VRHKPKNSPPIRRGGEADERSESDETGWLHYKYTTPSPDALRLCRIGLDPPLLPGGELFKIHNPFNFLQPPSTSFNPFNLFNFFNLFNALKIVDNSWKSPIPQELYLSPDFHSINRY